MEVIHFAWYRYSDWDLNCAVMAGGRRWSGGVPEWVFLNRLCPLLLEDGPDALQLPEGCFTEVAWHVKFEIVCQLACYCNELVLWCAIWIGDVFVFV